MAEKSPGDLVQQYFRVKARQLIAMADLPICEHGGLIGGHREELHRTYLNEILPKRYSVGRGMVYGFANHSKEADIVIWDAANYPILPLLDHSFFFAESVRVVLESKSQWKEEQFEDVLEKCKAVRDIIMFSKPNLRDDVEWLEAAVASLKAGIDFQGMVMTGHHIGTAAIFLKGGHTLTADSLSSERIETADDHWPDVLLFLEPGKVVIKEYEPLGEGFGRGYLCFYEFGEDALFAFTATLMALLNDRSVQVEDPLYLQKYVRSVVFAEPIATIQFPLTRPMPHRTPLWREHDADEEIAEGDDDTSPA